MLAICDTSKLVKQLWNTKLYYTQDLLFSSSKEQERMMNRKEIFRIGCIVWDNKKGGGIGNG